MYIEVGLWALQTYISGTIEILVLAGRRAVQVGLLPIFQGRRHLKIWTIEDGTNTLSWNVSTVRTMSQKSKDVKYTMATAWHFQQECLCQCNLLNANQMDQFHSVYSEISCNVFYLLVKQIIWKHTLFHYTVCTVVDRSWYCSLIAFIVFSLSVLFYCRMVVFLTASVDLPSIHVP